MYYQIPYPAFYAGFMIFFRIFILHYKYMCFVINAFHFIVYEILIYVAFEWNVALL